jgi:hypothetical protein
MVKRISAALIGLLGILAGFYACGLTFEVTKDFPSHEVSVWKELVGILLVGSVAFGGLTLGIRFLRFALVGQSPRCDGRFAVALLGLGCFFPGFIFSFPLCMLWAVHQVDENSAELTALGISLSVGVMAAIAGCALLLRERPGDGS